jgi:tripartite-type tricarboxylate transporter receptor subunit TctC
MKLLRRQVLHLAAGAGALVAFIGTATAQQYPIRPISMIVPFAAGGPQDVIGRVVAQRMGEILGQQVVVENIGGAGGTTGSVRVKNAAPDGYTFVWASVGTHAQSQTLYKRPAYNAVEDFTPVAFVGETPIALTVRKDLPVSNLQEFAAYAKANEAKMSFGSGGAGSAAHLGCVVLNMALKTNMTHVPYRGAAPALQDLHGGRIDFMCEIINTAKPHIESGAVKALAIMTKERSPVLPNLPTAAEQGIKLEAYTWSAVFLPKGAPADVVKKLNDAVVKALETPAVKERLEAMGVTVATPERRSPEYMAQFVRSEIAKWAEPIKASGAQIE